MDCIDFGYFNLLIRKYQLILIINDERKLPEILNILKTNRNYYIINQSFWVLEYLIEQHDLARQKQSILESADYEIPFIIMQEE